jgi:AcrR family transcriptional regulator
VSLSIHTVEWQESCHRIGGVPRLWNDTIEAHRRTVRDAVLDAAEELVADRGPAAVTMSQLAAASGIGRATLYKYFADVDSVLAAWHERLVERHLTELTAAGDRAGEPVDRLRAVLARYAAVRRHEPGGELAAALHRGDHLASAHHRLRGYVSGLLREAAARGQVRSDVPPEELAGYCLAALGAAAGARGPEAVDRLVAVTLAGLTTGGAAG